MFYAVASLWVVLLSDPVELGHRFVNPQPFRTMPECQLALEGIAREVAGLRTPAGQYILSARCLEANEMES